MKSFEFKATKNEIRKLFIKKKENYHFFTRYSDEYYFALQIQILINRKSL
jgi:hypothetical protein